MSAINGKSELAKDRLIYARDWGGGVFTDAVVVQNWKFMRFFRQPNERVYAGLAFDLDRDPREIHPVPERFDRAAGMIEEASGHHGVAYPASFVELPAEVEDRLRDLGYLQESE